MNGGSLRAAVCRSSMMRCGFRFSFCFTAMASAACCAPAICAFQNCEVKGSGKSTSCPPATSLVTMRTVLTAFSWHSLDAHAFREFQSSTVVGGPKFDLALLTVKSDEAICPRKFSLKLGHTQLAALSAKVNMNRSSRKSWPSQALSCRR